MRWGSFLLALLFTASCATTRIDTPSEPDTPAALAIITWNMDAGRGDLTRLASDLVSGHLTGVPPLDYVFLLQEAVSGIGVDAADLAQARGLHAFVVPVHELEGRVRAVAIVSTQPLQDTRAIALPQERQPRMAALATITTAGQALFVLSTHLENRVSWLRGGVFSDGARGRQVEALLPAVPDGPGVLGGDLNTLLGPAEPAWRRLAERFPDTPDEPLGPTFRDRLVLDHLFFDLPEGWRAQRRVLEDRYGSDHHPVLGLVFQAGGSTSVRGLRSPL